MPRIVASLDSLLRRKLSIGAYNSVWFSWWCVSFYLVRSVTSRFEKQTPKIQQFGGGARHLTERIQDVNVLASTRMCRVMTSHRSDKGHRRHNYTTIYCALFKGRLGESLRIFELGLGTNNPGFAFNMGAVGQPGASLRGWRQLFPRARVFGADIDRSVLFDEDRITTFYCDQLDSKAIRDLWSNAELSETMDIIVEDGLHTFDANISFLDGSLEHLRAGGIYVIEDIATDTLERWREQLGEVYSKRYPAYGFALVELPNSYNAFDNNMVLVHKSP